MKIYLDVFLNHKVDKKTSGRLKTNIRSIDYKLLSFANDRPYVE